jgi:hypothetical protein
MAHAGAMNVATTKKRKSPDLIMIDPRLPSAAAPP